MTLRGKVVSGLFWTGGTRVLSQILTWAITVVVIRLLSPADYGLLAMATVFVNFLTLVAEAGLGAAIVQAPTLDRAQLRQIFGAVVLIDLALFALQFALAPLIAGFFQEERLVVIIRVLALQFLMMIFSVIPTSMLARKLDFKRPSVIGLVASICGSVGTLMLALAGYGVWALVFGTLATSLFNTIAINVVAPYLQRPSFSLRGMRRLVVFGTQVTAARVLWFLYSQADVFIAGRLLGKELLGFYSISMHLASLPVQKISSVVNQVAYPAFAQTLHEPALASAYMLKAIRIISLFAFPVLWGISSIAEEIVAVLLGPKWEAAVTPLKLLPLVMPVSMLSTFLHTAFQGSGHGRVVLMNVITAFLVMPASFLVGVNWGLAGLSAAWVIAFPVVFLLNLRRMLPLVGLKLSDVWAAAAMPAVASAVMYGCVVAARQVITSHSTSIAAMVALVGVGAATYALITLAMNKRGISEFASMFRKERADGGAP